MMLQSGAQTSNPKWFIYYKKSALRTLYIIILYYIEVLIPCTATEAVTVQCQQLPFLDYDMNVLAVTG